MNFIDLQEQYRRYQPEIDGEIAKVLEAGHFILGQNVKELEREISLYTGSDNVVCCSSGTDALLLALMALGVKREDEIIVPDFTFFATAEVVSFYGATPVFVDVDPETYNIDIQLVKKKISNKTRGIIAVSLFGQCADFNELSAICENNGIFILEDAAQSFGGTYYQRKSGALTEIATTSFYPAKPLGCYGDGGAVFTRNKNVADFIRMLLNHGQSEQYKHDYIGINGRLDELQAAVLRVKLGHFNEELDRREHIAAMYSELLTGIVDIPVIRGWNRSAWAQYTIRSKKRDKIIALLKESEIPTAIHYPVPLHKQKAFANSETDDADFAVSNRICEEVLSLPMHPFLTSDEVRKIADKIKEAAL